jgi:hypothetical protein
MATFAFYTDAALTSPFAGNLVAAQNADGSTDPIVTALYFGSTDEDRQAQADSNPGVDNLAVTIADSAPGTGHATTEVKLASTQGGLAGATPGASLSLGTTVLGGVENAKPIWIQVDDATATIGTATELSIEINGIRESVIP